MNSKKLKTAAQLFIVVCIIAFASCTKPPKIDWFEITINDMQILVDDEVVDFIRIEKTDSFSIRIFGIIGPNDCYKLHSVYATLEELNVYVIQAIGIYEENKNGIPCDPVEALLNHELRAALRDENGKILFDSNEIYTFKAGTVERSILFR